MWIFWDEKNTVSNYTYKWIFGKKRPVKISRLLGNFRGFGLGCLTKYP